MMAITSDWHIHSRNSCDEAALAVADLMTQTRDKGILDYGLSDHIHTPYNLPDLARSRAEYQDSAPGARFHFGVELSCVSQWELDLIRKGGVQNPVYGIRSGGPPAAPLALGIGRQELELHGVEFVVGGTHWPMYVPLERGAVIQDYHRQNMFLATHPLVDIVAHPWWWHGHWQDPDGSFAGEPWFGDFGCIPATVHAEFAAAAVEYRKRVEINLSAMLLNPHYPESFKQQYLEYLAYLKARGVALCIGSDCHGVQYDIDFRTPERMLARVGIQETDLWALEPREDCGPSGS